MKKAPFVYVTANGTRTSLIPVELQAEHTLYKVFAWDDWVLN